MTNNRTRLARVVPLDQAHAGDLIGFNKRGQALYLPGGGAAIVAEPDDDDFGGSDGGGDDDDDDGDDVTPPAPKLNTQKLLEENAKLQAAVKRNNKELRDRRVLGQLMEKHGITDLDAWLANLNINPETGKPTATPAASTEPLVAAPTTPTVPPTPTTSAAADEAEINRRIELEVAKRIEADKAKAEAREEKLIKLGTTLRDQAMRLALKELGFTGTYETARRVLDLDALEIDDESHEVKGAAEAARNLQAEIPEWFRPKRAPGATRTGGSDVDGPAKRPPAPAPKKWDQRVADALGNR